MTAIQDSVVRPLVEALSRRPAGLITDIDGTISPIAPTPAEAVVTPLCRRFLSELCARLDLVAAVSGRSAEDAYGMLGIQGMVYVGNHGLETWQNGRVEVLPEAKDYLPLIAAAVADVAAATRQLAGIIYENKGVTASIHYRLSPDRALARQSILEALGASKAASHLRFTEGRMVVEIRPPVQANKGTAVETLLRTANLRGAVYLGDDVTDVDAFRALRRWASVGNGLGLSVGVLAAETPAAVRENTDLTVEGVAQVENLLERLAAAVP
ncbi:MAG: trehalose-phosphatase [Chloroflexota bacterium]